MTRSEKERIQEFNYTIRGQKKVHIVEVGVLPCNKSYCVIRETASGYYIQSFDTIVLYVSKKNGKLVNTWGSYSKATIIHINKALNWIKDNTETMPKRNHLSNDQYCKLSFAPSMGQWVV